MIDLYRLCEDLKNPQSDFRKKSDQIVYDILDILLEPSLRTKEIIREWKKDFCYLYGNVQAAGFRETGQAQMRFYALQTYFSILLKMMMQEILCPGFQMVSGEDIIRGRFAEQKGIKNYCCPDWYFWPVYEMENGFETVMNKMWEEIARYRNELSLTEFVQNNNYDYIKQMYEAVIPRELRHVLGEYYTPDWLAEETIATALSFGIKNAAQSFIDPTCGSGTFLFKLIAEKRKLGQPLGEIIKTVRGIDINPLAVFTAKTNYLLAVADLIEPENETEIPVYQADVIKLGEKTGDAGCPDFVPADLQGAVRKFRYADQQRAAKLEKADVLLGNPPWVNWEYMPEEYRAESRHLWVDYQLFSAKGRNLSFSKEDISVLITYIAMDKLLKAGGILAFVIRQGVFKSARNGSGFRRFFLKDECGIKVLRADDLSRLRVFENAAASTAVLYLKKGEETVYPVPYIVWDKRDSRKRMSFNGWSGLGEVRKQVKLTERQAKPAVQDDLTSMWMTTDDCSRQMMEEVLGTNRYKARTGVFTGGANAVYWLEILQRADEKIEISNVVERARRKTQKVSWVIEPDYVFPMLKGSNVRRWNVSYDTYLLCPHTAETKMWPVSRNVLEETVPDTFAYLRFFQKDLDQRKGFAGWEREIQRQEFQAVLRVGDYTFARYKVVWKYISSEFVCAVIGSVQDEFLGEKLLFPNEKIMYVGTDCEDEAYYLCGILSSTRIADCVKSYMNPTSISAHVLDKLNIADFDRGNPSHMEIARICREGHGKEDVTAYIERIDRIVDRLYRKQ